MLFKFNQNIQHVDIISAQCVIIYVFIFYITCIFNIIIIIIHFHTILFYVLIISIRISASGPFVVHICIYRTVLFIYRYYHYYNIIYDFYVSFFWLEKLIEGFNSQSTFCAPLPRPPCVHRHITHHIIIFIFIFISGRTSIRIHMCRQSRTDTLSNIHECVHDRVMALNDFVWMPSSFCQLSMLIYAHLANITR